MRRANVTTYIKTRSYYRCILTRKLISSGFWKTKWGGGGNVKAAILHDRFQAPRAFVFLFKVNFTRCFRGVLWSRLRRCTFGPLKFEWGGKLHDPNKRGRNHTKSSPNIQLTHRNPCIKSRIRIRAVTVCWVESASRARLEVLLLLGLI